MRRVVKNRQSLDDGRSTWKPKIVLVTGWWKEDRQSAVPTALKLASILQPLSSQLSWIITNQAAEGSLNGGITIVEIRVRHMGGKVLPIVILYDLLHQAKVTLAMLKLIRLSKAEVFVFAFGSDALVLPILFGRFAGKKVILRSDGRASYAVRRGGQKLGKTGIAIRSMLYHMTEVINYSLASKLATECMHMVDSYSLQKYSSKVAVGSLYIDTHIFKNTKKLTERTYDVGFIGRLHKEKGALEFAQSLPLLTANRHIHAIIVGDGELRDNIETILARDDIQGKVDLLRWVANKEISRYLSDIKVLVIPSYFEGLPNVVLESMACGTPVLATPVGGIPGVIRDGETGFIMEDNSPECIAKNVMRVLDYPNLERIAINARTLIDKEYSYEVVVESYRNILTSLKSK